MLWFIESYGIVFFIYCTVLLKLKNFNLNQQYFLITYLYFNLGRLTWLVYLIGAAIGGRVTFNSNDDGDAMDGEMACKVLQLMTFSDSRLPQGGYEKLEHSFLFFFEQFRKIYIGDQVRNRIIWVVFNLYIVYVL